MSAVDSVSHVERGAPLAPSKSLRVLIADLFGYGLVSAAALGLDWGLLIAFVKAGLNYQVASAMSFTTGMLLAYAGSVLLIFRGRRQRTIGAEAVGFFRHRLSRPRSEPGASVRLRAFRWPRRRSRQGADGGFVFTFNFFARRTLLFVS